MGSRIPDDHPEVGSSLSQAINDWQPHLFAETGGVREEETSGRFDLIDVPDQDTVVPFDFEPTLRGGGRPLRR